MWWAHEGADVGGEGACAGTVSLGAALPGGAADAECGGEIEFEAFGWDVFATITAIAVFAVLHPRQRSPQAGLFLSAACLARFGHRLIEQSVLTAEASDGLLVEFNSLCSLCALGQRVIQLCERLVNKGFEAGDVCFIHFDNIPHHSFAFAHLNLRKLSQSGRETCDG